MDRHSRHLIAGYIDSSFGHAADGRRLFMPFGKFGHGYIVASQAELMRLRQWVGCFIVPSAVPVLLMASLFLRPVRDAALAPILIAIAASMSVFLAAYGGWVFVATRGMGRLESGDEAILIQRDPQQAACVSIIAYLHERAPGADPASLLTAAGSVAGFTIQMLVREQARLEGRPSELIEVALANGRLLYFGDVLNALLAEDSRSMWSIIADRAPVDAIHDLFLNAVAELSDDACGGKMAEMVSAVREHRQAIAYILNRYEIPISAWHLTQARSIRELIYAQTALLPDVARRVAMRAAILMSKWDPADVLVSDLPADPSSARG